MANQMECEKSMPSRVGVLERNMNFYSKLKPGKTEYALVDMGWDNYIANNYYNLVMWQPQQKEWGYMANGNKEWADRTAKHYKIKIQ